VGARERAGAGVLDEDLSRRVDGGDVALHVHAARVPGRREPRWRLRDLVQFVVVA
jgi:hypothetical protein